MKIRNGFVSNSSGSSFICKTKDNLKTVKEKLQLILDCHNALSGENLIFDNVFCEPYYGSQDYDKKLVEWGYWRQVYNSDTTVGKVVIDSATDNSIPSEWFEIIESTFNAERIHLG